LIVSSALEKEVIGWRQRGLRQVWGFRCRGGEKPIPLALQGGDLEAVPERHASTIGHFQYWVRRCPDLHSGSHLTKKKLGVAKPNLGLRVATQPIPAPDHQPSTH
jgi:hypothetical protein